MGGKKPVGAAPSRGHHHNTSHSGHHSTTSSRVWSTPQFSYWGSETVFNQPTTQSPATTPALSIPTPVLARAPIVSPLPDQSIEALEKRITELSSELANVKDTVSTSNSVGVAADNDMFSFGGLSDSRPMSRLFGGEYEEEAREDDDFPLLLFSSPQIGGSRGPNHSKSLDDMWRRINVMEDDIRRLNNRDEHIHSLEMAVRSLTDRLNKTDQFIKSSPSPVKASPASYDRKQATSPLEAGSSGSRLSSASEPFTPSSHSPLELRKLQDRVRTLEGRQGALQSKISAADSVLGRTGAAWASSLKSMAVGSGEVKQGAPPTDSALEALIRRVDAIEQVKSN